MIDYRVALESFHGPLDLLLYLVKREEVDIREISILRLAEQFLEFLTTMQTLDVELAGEFLVMAATLLEIKARSLLPADREEDEYDSTSADSDASDANKTASEGSAARVDPRRTLVKQLLEYRRFKDAATQLERLAETQATRMPRLPTEALSSPRLAAVKPVELWDLVAAFARILRETNTTTGTTIQADDTPQYVYEARVEAAVQQAGRLPLRDLFTPPFLRYRLIGLFLAVLELVKQQKLLLEQPQPYGEIYLMISEAVRESPHIPET